MHIIFIEKGIFQYILQKEGVFMNQNNSCGCCQNQEQPSSCLRSPVGPKGDQGPVGLQGVKGDSGCSGPQGIQGEVDPIGAQGPKGCQEMKAQSVQPGP